MQEQMISSKISIHTIFSPNFKSGLRAVQYIFCYTLLCSDLLSVGVLDVKVEMSAMLRVVLKVMVLFVDSLMQTARQVLKSSFKVSVNSGFTIEATKKSKLLMEFSIE